MTTADGSATTESDEASSRQPFWRQSSAAFRRSNTRRALTQLVNTLPVLVVLFFLMYWSLAHSYWLTLAIAPLAAGFLLRSFVIMHDCAHGSFLPWRLANETIGFLTGVLTMTPFVQWRRDHALHHASSGDLDRRGHGDITTLTVDEYLALNRWERLRYRAFRNPFVLFGLGPLYLMVNQRRRSPSTATAAMQSNSVLHTNLAILFLGVAFSLLIGWQALLLVYMPVFLIASSAGIWLFYVQHQFEDAYWQTHESWAYTSAALQGSSYYRLPRVLEWFSGSIGLHHAHHLDPRIPNYHLRSWHESVDAFKTVPVLTLRKSLRSIRLSLWDEKAGRMVGFSALSSDRRR